ncbi:MAG: hypothetical protein R6U89_06490, partial [Dehalococcoidia bacterium]
MDEIHVRASAISGRMTLILSIAAIIAAIILFATPMISYGQGYGGPSICYPPQVATQPADDITTSSATLNGALNSLGTDSSVVVSFEWGTAMPGSNETEQQVMIATGDFSASITDLQPSTTYYFRAKAVGCAPAEPGSYESFTTASAPSPTPTETPTPTPAIVDGTFTGDFDLSTECLDCGGSIFVLADTLGQDAAGTPITYISVEAPDSIAAPLREGMVLIGACDFLPDGAHFSK